MTGSLTAIIAGAVNSIISALYPHAPASVQAITSLLNDVGLAAFAACVGIAILRYRLYDIDRIISRTLAYAIVTGLLAGVYAGLVLLATRVLSFLDLDSVRDDLARVVRKALEPDHVSVWVSDHE